MTVGRHQRMCGRTGLSPTQLPVPSAWSEEQPPGAEAHTAAIAQSWTMWKDPMLEPLISRAVQSNVDRRTAAARVHAVRAQHGIVAGDLGWNAMNPPPSKVRRTRLEWECLSAVIDAHDI